ncbi:hypothetical protein ABPG75_009488 [Micractinium tetrahymenae]
MRLLRQLDSPAFAQALDGQLAALVDAEAGDSDAPASASAPPSCRQLTTRMLHVALCCRASDLAGAMLRTNHPHGHVGSSEEAGRQAVAEASAAQASLAARLLRLEPDSPRSRLLASLPAQPVDVEEQGEDEQAAWLQERARAVQLVRRAFILAQQQGSLYWTVRAGANVMLLAGREVLVTGRVQRGSLEGALAALAAAEQALRRARKLLPEHWVWDLQSLMNSAGKCQQTAAAQLRIMDAARCDELVLVHGVGPVPAAQASSTDLHRLRAGASDAVHTLHEAVYGQALAGARNDERVCATCGR